jgi:hypothetical protein
MPTTQADTAVVYRIQALIIAHLRHAIDR